MFILMMVLLQLKANHNNSKYSGNDNIKVDTRKGESGNEANHQIRLEMAEQRNIGFIEENERDGQESGL